MVDHLSAELRSRLMGRIRCTDTQPELKVRRLVHAMGYRYRLHRRDLPGTPDLTFTGRRKIIFVHGCFWHQHGCRRGMRPSSNRDFWNRKLDRNIHRDQETVAALKRNGWSILVVWECETNDLTKLANRLKNFLSISVGAA